MQKLFEMYWDFGRSGSLEGVFVAEQEEIDFLMGKQIYWGEVLGKHSEVYGTLRPEHITVKSDDPAVVEFFSEYVGSSCYNPVAYFESYYADGQYTLAEIMAGAGEEEE